VTQIDLRRDDEVVVATRIAEDIAGPAAADVDRWARFPEEAFQAIRAEGLLSALVPIELGGSGARLGEVAGTVTSLSRGCSSTGLIFAMHQIQVACLVRHGGTPFFHEFLRREVVERQSLLASATTEHHVGGDVRTSRCAVEELGGRFALTKQAPVISYGAYAGAVLATARRTADSPPSDQVLVLCRRPGLLLEGTGSWDTLGFRGTCSNGFRLSAEDVIDAVLPDSYGEISSRTMLPVSHVLWASVWLGMAHAAVGHARAYVRSAARKTPGVTPPAAVHLAELMALHQQMESLVRSAIQRYDEFADDYEPHPTMAFAIAMNGVKVSASTMVVDIVGRALAICGMAGYRQDSPISLGRLLRDAYGAALMVNNDRILVNSAQMLLVSKEA
jgi:acyl-CoA dehydrogenase